MVMGEQKESRKAFHFDLSTKKLMLHYPSDKKFGWRKAWSDIRSFMEGHGFEHAQFSGYESIEPMGYDKAYAIMKSLSETYPWFTACAKAATYTDIGERFDVLAFLNRKVKDVAPPPVRSVKITEERDNATRVAHEHSSDCKTEHELPVKGNDR